MKKILFLGYNSEQTSLIDKIQFHKKKWSVKQTQKEINLNKPKIKYKVEKNIHNW